MAIIPMMVGTFKNQRTLCSILNLGKTVPTKTDQK